MTAASVRKGATRASDIPENILEALSRGEIQSATLAECMALNQATLMRVVFPRLSSPALKAIDAACELGVLKRMARIGEVLLNELGAAGIAQCSSHGADTVRGWACFMVGAQSGLDVVGRLAAVRPLGVWAADGSQLDSARLWT